MFKRIKETWKSLSEQEIREKIEWLKKQETRGLKVEWPNNRLRMTFKELEKRELAFRSLLWAIRYHLLYEDPMTSSHARGRMLGVRLQRMLELRDLPYSPPKSPGPSVCPNCHQELKERVSWVCPACQYQEGTSE